MIDQALEDFRRHFGAEGPVGSYFAPGRVNLIGEHLDYNGGHVFPAAISLGICAVARPRNDSLVRLRSADFPGETVVDPTKPLHPEADHPWSNYPKGVVRELVQRGASFRGYDILFKSTLPAGAGLSSSAALEVLTAYILTDKPSLSDEERIQLAHLGCRAENDFVGLKCGIMDQFAVAMGKRDSALLLHTSTLDYNVVGLNMGAHCLVIMNTNKPRQLRESKYNERRTECEQALALLQQTTPCLRALADASMDAVKALAAPVLRKRARHVVTENTRVLQAVESLNAGRLEDFGKHLTASHQSLRDDYEVTGKELDTLVEAALTVPGCLGARMTGAGFGGCAIALLVQDQVDTFKSTVMDTYTSQTGLCADLYIAEIADGVHQQAASSTRS